MNAGRTVFSQLIEHAPGKEFQKCLARYRGDVHLRDFSCWDQYLTMAFAQLTYRESLRDIEACLRALGAKLYHMGFQGKVARSTLADANESRDWRIFADFAQVLIRIARPLCATDPIGVDLDHNLYALDSTTIDLCLSLFPWAKFRKHKAAVKMHTLLDLHGKHPHVHQHYQRHSTRCQHSRRDPAGGRGVLRHGPRVRRFRTPVRLHAQRSLLRRTHEIQHSAPAAVLTLSGQNHRRSIRSHRNPDSHRFREGVPGSPATGQLSRRGNQEEVQVPDEQLHASGTYHRPDLQDPV